MQVTSFWQAWVRPGHKKPLSGLRLLIDRDLLRAKPCQRRNAEAFLYGHAPCAIAVERGLELVRKAAENYPGQRDAGLFEDDDENE